MPHAIASSGGDDFGSNDEVKVFKEEGEESEKTSENLIEEKSSLIDLTESEEKSSLTGRSFSVVGKNGSRLSPTYGKFDPATHAPFSMGHLVPPYPYSNGTAGALPVCMANKVGIPSTHPSSLPFFYQNGDQKSQPPPAHMGIPPYQPDTKTAASAMSEYFRELSLRALASRPRSPNPAEMLSPADWKRIGPFLAASGLARPPVHSFTPPQYPYPMLSPEISHVAASWHAPSMYPISTVATGFCNPYSSALPITSSGLPSDLYRFPPADIISHNISVHRTHHSLGPHPAVVTPGPKQELPSTYSLEHNHRPSLDQQNSTSSRRDINKGQDSGHLNNSQEEKRKPHIKKPLNAFMLFMKEKRAEVIHECTLKESAAINQILGKRWHALTRQEQTKYYDMARQERQLHMQLYPDWSSRTNYSRGKKRKRKPETHDGNNSMKKCRARFGLDQQHQWCKPCRRKKKCIRYMKSIGENIDEGNQSEDNVGSCGSEPDICSPPGGDKDSLPNSLSSPGGLSELSSLTSPSMILPSPVSLASPSVGVASPCMSVQSPLTPQFDVSVSSPHPLPLPPLPPLHRNPVGTNPHDVNNPLSVNQLTRQCIKIEPMSVDQLTGQFVKAES